MPATHPQSLASPAGNAPTHTLGLNRRQRRTRLPSHARGSLCNIDGGGADVHATVNFEFATIRKDRISKEVAQKIEHFILTKLKPGNKLPAERELAKMLGVSRCSLRDALLRLEVVGLIESRQGAGTVVREISADA